VYGTLHSLVWIEGEDRSKAWVRRTVCKPKDSFGGEIVTPSVLHRKSFTKTCHEHHVYVLMQVIKCVDQFL